LARRSAASQQTQRLFSLSAGFFRERLPVVVTHNKAAPLVLRQTTAAGSGECYAVQPLARSTFLLSVDFLLTAEGCAYAGCTQGAVPHAKKAGSKPLPASSIGRKLASTPKALRQSPIIVRLGTDSVNPFRQQITNLSSALR